MDFSGTYDLLGFSRADTKEIAARLGYTQALISEVENKRKHPSTRLKVALTREFHEQSSLSVFNELKMEMV